MFSFKGSYSDTVVITPDNPYSTSGAGLGTLNSYLAFNSSNLVRYKIAFSSTGTPNSAFNAALVNNGSKVSSLTTGIMQGGGGSLSIFGAQGYTVTGVGSFHWDWSASCQAVFQELRPNSLHFFGIGVDWSAVSCLSGDVDAKNLMNTLSKKLPAFSNSTVVTLDATASGANNANTITTQFNQFKTTVGANDTVIFYVSTHGDSIGQISPLFLLPISSDEMDSLDANTIASYLKLLPPSTRKIVILDTCHAGGIAAELPHLVPGVQIAAASTANGTSSSNPNDCTGLFTDFIIGKLNAEFFDLSEIINDVVPGTYNNYFGEALSLRDSGTAIFTGLQPQLWEGSGFGGDLLGPSMANLQSPPVPLAKIINGSFQLCLTNVPISGSIAIETSTDLISWLQVAFTPAAGTNLNYFFPVTNNPCAFFRAKVIP